MDFFLFLYFVCFVITYVSVWFLDKNKVGHKQIEPFVEFLATFVLAAIWPILIFAIFAGLLQRFKTNLRRRRR